MRFLASAVAVAALFFTGCGSSDSPTVLNTEKVERAIEYTSLAQRGAQAQVTCPSGVHQRKGLVFACTAVVRGRATRFVITQLDSSGRVHYEAR